MPPSRRRNDGARPQRASAPDASESRNPTATHLHRRRPLVVFHFLLSVVVVVAAMSAPSSSSSSSPNAAAPRRRTLAVGTRIHLGKASSPPPPDKLERAVSSFVRFANECGATSAAIAVDPEEKVEGYDLVSSVRSARDAAIESFRSESSSAAGGGGGGGGEEKGSASSVEVDVIPVTPWGNFVPALNALIAWSSSRDADLCLFASAETDASPSAVEALCERADEDTLVVGAALPGHDYRSDPSGDGGSRGDGGGAEVELTGRTTPWNTFAMWNVPKLALTGFPLVSDGLHRMEDGSTGPSGVEEVSTIAVLQRLLPFGTAKAKLVKVNGIAWDQEWDDEERKRWHESKMKSKVERARRHLSLLGLEGTVWHC